CGCTGMLTGRSLIPAVKSRISRLTSSQIPISHDSEETADVTRSRSHLIHGLAADHGADDLDVLDLLLIHRVQIFGEHDEVGKLARRDRSLDRFLTRGIGAVERIDPQRLV